MSGRTRTLLLTAAALVVVVAVVAVALAVVLQEPAEGPREVAWDREACAHCRMLVSEPAFAVQARRGDGTAVAFDDPGCYFAWREEERAEPGEVWFRHLREERWVAEADVAFVEVSPTPMGFGLGAVGAGEGELSVAAAGRRTHERELSLGGAP
jgi:hypothetical protein